ncbi:hypothetical protein FA95DRAFT_116171 [Auriscalpium vulgare]|uniref:Uncharacterized protein n=1 Tax=Auriscalpium vulgare TaxID=40419 RepID=A0ACB8RN36_9AGAM|nr:hypothetical protein FA95DRAFT_116171 [Auriscalpium vulgare]
MTTGPTRGATLLRTCAALTTCHVRGRGDGTEFSVESERRREGDMLQVSPRYARLAPQGRHHVPRHALPSSSPSRPQLPFIVMPGASQAALRPSLRPSSTAAASRSPYLRPHPLRTLCTPMAYAHALHARASCPRMLHSHSQSLRSLAARIQSRHVTHPCRRRPCPSRPPTLFFTPAPRLPVPLLT